MAAGVWTTDPVDARLVGEHLAVTAREASDAWRHTSYNFVHDTEHALVAPLGLEGAVEVGFTLNFDRQFDQAGVFLRVDETEWIKAGVEIVEGVAHVGAVVTHGTSDWSMAPVPEWFSRNVTIRLSRHTDAVTIRARVEEEPWRLVRVANLGRSAVAQAGLYCCSPSRAGLTVTFTTYGVGPRDETLHE